MVQSGEYTREARHEHTMWLAHQTFKLTFKAINQVAKSVGTVYEVCEVVERENHAVRTSSVHNKPSFAKDLELIVSELDEQQVFMEQDRHKRCYHSIKNVLQLTSKEKLRVWIPKNTSYNIVFFY